MFLFPGEMGSISLAKLLSIRSVNKHHNSTKNRKVFHIAINNSTTTDDTNDHSQNDSENRSKNYGNKNNGLSIYKFMTPTEDERSRWVDALSYYVDHNNLHVTSGDTSPSTNRNRNKKRIRHKATFHNQNGSDSSQDEEEQIFCDEDSDPELLTVEPPVPPSEYRNRNIIKGNEHHQENNYNLDIV